MNTHRAFAKTNESIERLTNRQTYRNIIGTRESMLSYVIRHCPLRSAPCRADSRAPCRARLRPGRARAGAVRSEEHTSELQSLMRISYAVFCLKKKIKYKM